MLAIRREISLRFARALPKSTPPLPCRDVVSWTQHSTDNLYLVVAAGDFLPRRGETEPLIFQLILLGFTTWSGDTACDCEPSANLARTGTGIYPFAARNLALNG